MSLLRLLWLSLTFHWRGNLAVLLGVVVGATVLTGALLVGDSLQGSLRAQSERRLGWVAHALVAPRFFREALAGEVASTADARVSPALLLQATAAAGHGADRRQLRGVTVLGLEGGFFNADAPPGWWFPEPTPTARVNRAVADALGVRPGDRLTLRLQKPGDVPREAGLGKKDLAFEDWELTVGPLLEEELAARFNLRPELTTPRNIVVHLPRLQERLGLPGQANALLAAGGTEALAQALNERLTLDDWGLSLRTPASRARALVAFYDTDNDGKLSYGEWVSTRLAGKDVPRYARVIEGHVKPASRRVRTEDDFRAAFTRAYPYLALESRQLILPRPVAAAALRAAKDADLRAAETIVYLARWRVGDRSVAGVVAALDPREKPPLGPFLPRGATLLADGQIVLVAADGAPTAAPGTIITLRYKPPESHGPAPDRTANFVLAGTLPPTGPAGDPFLTPDFPGITDKDDVGAWDLPFDDDDWRRNISREYGDAYWKQYRGTPKAYITLARGKELFGSDRFGDITSIRLAPAGEADLERAAERYRAALRRHLTPASGGFVFDPVRAAALEASQGGTPFGLLFLGFSFFLILSALLLVGLLYRLNLDRRATQVGVLFAEGYRRGVVRRLFLGEGGLLALVGVVLGAGLALAYSRLLVELLAALWPGGTLRSLLRPHASMASLLAGAGGALVVSVLTVAWVVRVLGKVPPRALLAGQTGDDAVSEPASRLSLVVVIAAALLGVVLLVVGPWVPGHEARAGTFFGSGAMFLTAGLVGLLAWMKRARHASVEGAGAATIARLGVRNAARHPMRSLLTVGLLASAAFLLVAVESFRRRVPVSDGTPQAADGGFALMAESDLPMIRDPGTPAGRAEMLRGLAEAGADVGRARELLEATTIIALRARAGDDASCLNLYKPKSPRMLGVPARLIERGGFVFDATAAAGPAEKTNPWLVLARDGPEVPAFGEANTVMWMLRSGLGGKIAVPDERGGEAALTVRGLLHDSVFQSSLLVSERRFLELYPGHEGYNYFLIAPPAGREAEVKRLLERALADRGLEVTRTAERLEAYLAVENTYLTTFQALGGLGLVLGALGLAVVLLRSVWERRAELALLRAMGWGRGALAWLLLTENAFLLLVGLGLGASAALLSITPQLISGEGAVPVGNLLVLFAGVLAVGLIAGAVALAGALRAAIVPALRRE